MMRASSAVTISCLLAAVTLSCGSAYEELRSLDDLKKIDFGGSVPKHTLLLLHWFANTVYIDDNDVIHLTFNANTQFGSRPYNSYENFLPADGRKYYIVGSPNGVSSTQLPEYVREPLFREYEGTGTDRIKFRVKKHTDNHTIDKISITQHYDDSSSGSGGDQEDDTYHISTNLLKQIRLFSIEGNLKSLSKLRDQFDSNDYQLSYITDTWGKQAYLGLLLTIVCGDKPAVCRDSEYQFNQSEKRGSMNLRVVTSGSGNAKILWRNVPTDLVKCVALVLYDNKMIRKAYIVINTNNGSSQTPVALSDGLQVKMHRVTMRGSDNIIKQEICGGREFQSPDAVVIKDYKAYLQLFVRNGKACARIYVKKSFTDWRSEFYHSWVGFYKSAKKGTHDYETQQWQWVIKFEQSHDSGDNNVLEYCSGMTVETGVQARFIIRDFRKTAASPAWP